MRKQKCAETSDNNVLQKLTGSRNNRGYKKNKNETVWNTTFGIPQLLPMSIKI